MKDDLAKTLTGEAEKALRRAIAPYSGFKVGVALITRKGNVYTGCNIENPSLMMSICAEKVAIVKALSEGEKAIKALAIATNEKDYCFPCGSCRQLLLEFANGADIFLSSRKGLKRYSVDELLPYAFSKDFA